MKLSKIQKAIIYGLILGDGYLQKTGEKNARLRLEYSCRNKEYVDWLYKKLENVFARKPQKVLRKHPQTKKIYCYYRLQSNSSPFFGKLRRSFYSKEGKKAISENIGNKLKYALTLAVWYMDDGAYYKRDKSAHIYLPLLGKGSQERLMDCLRKSFALRPKIYCRPDRKACQLNFVGAEKDRLFSLIRDYILPCYFYKIDSSGPVSTEGEN